MFAHRQPAGGVALQLAVLRVVVDDDGEAVARVEPDHPEEARQRGRVGQVGVAGPGGAGRQGAGRLRRQPDAVAIEACGRGGALNATASRGMGLEGFVVGTGASAADRNDIKYRGYIRRESM